MSRRRIDHGLSQVEEQYVKEEDWSCSKLGWGAICQGWSWIKSGWGAICQEELMGWWEKMCVDMK